MASSSADPAVPTPDAAMREAQRASVKGASSDPRSKRKEALREFGRAHRRALLTQHRRLSASPGAASQLAADTLQAMRAELWQQPPDDEGALTEADIEQLLRDVEASVLEEIQHELLALEQEHQEQQRALEAAEHLYQQHAASVAAGDSAVPCPVCRAAQLVQRHGWLVCPKEGWQLNLAAESLTLEAVRSRLAAAYSEHAAAGCPGQLVFAVEGLFDAGLSLTCSCSSCSALMVVL